MTWGIHCVKGSSIESKATLGISNTYWTCIKTLISLPEIFGVLLVVAKRCSVNFTCGKCVSLNSSTIWTWSINLLLNASLGVKTLFLRVLRVYKGRRLRSLIVLSMFYYTAWTHFCEISFYCSVGAVNGFHGRFELWQEIESSFILKNFSSFYTLV